jgi:hypothetical protein
VSDQPTPGSAPTGRLVVATIAALATAGILLITAVLPAEYGIDPTGIGEALGLTAMTQTDEGVLLTPLAEDADADGGPLVNAPRAYSQDTATFTLGPERWVEYKYALGQGGTLLYEWEATGPLTFDLHTEPVGTAASESESFAQGSSSGETGSYRAPYSGFHGWYWLNEDDTDVEVTLTAAGFFTQSRQYNEDGTVVDRDRRPGTGAAVVEP